MSRAISHKISLEAEFSRAWRIENRIPRHQIFACDGPRVAHGERYVLRRLREDPPDVVASVPTAWFEIGRDGRQEVLQQTRSGALRIVDVREPRRPGIKARPIALGTFAEAQHRAAHHDDAPRPRQLELALAHLHARPLGAPERALPALRGALAADPGFEPAQMDLEALLRSLGRGQELARLTEDLLVPAGSVIDQVRGVAGDMPCLFIGDGARRYERLLLNALGGRARLCEENTVSSCAAAVARLGMERVRRSEADDLGELVPVYLRPSEAEAKRSNVTDGEFATNFTLR